MKSLIFLFVIVILGCKKTDQNINLIQGDIYIKLIDVGTFYGASDELISNIKNEILNDSLKVNLKNSDSTLIKYYKILINHKLLDKPYFKLKMKNDSIINVYTNENEYSKVEKYLHNLDRDNEKLIVKFIGIKKESSIYYTEEIISVNKEKGKTDWRK